MTPLHRRCGVHRKWVTTKLDARRGSNQHGRITRLLHVCASRSYYDVLEVPTDAGVEDIRSAFRQKARLLHPDINKQAGADQQFMELKHAYDVLCEPMLRAEHDTQLGLPSARANDPRFARFERWRREVVPDLHMVLDEWTNEIEMVILEVSQQFYQTVSAVKEASSSLDQGILFSESGGDCTDGDWIHTLDRMVLAMQELAAGVDAMNMLAGNVRAQVQRLYDKRYDQVSQRYPAYPDLVWYDIWEEVSDEWVRKSEERATEWMNASQEYRGKLDAIRAALGRITKEHQIKLAVESQHDFEVSKE